MFILSTFITLYLMCWLRFHPAFPFRRSIHVLGWDVLDPSKERCCGWKDFPRGFADTLPYLNKPSSAKDVKNYIGQRKPALRHWKRAVLGLLWSCSTCWGVSIFVVIFFLTNPLLFCYFCRQNKWFLFLNLPNRQVPNLLKWVLMKIPDWFSFRSFYKVIGTY